MIKEYLLPVALVIVALIVYNMFVKKALKLDSYDMD